MVTKDQLEPHTAFQGNPLKTVLNPFTRDLKAVKLPFQSGEENAGVKIGVLVEVKDVATVSKNKIGDSGNQPMPAWARDN